MFYCERCEDADCCERLDLPTEPVLCDKCYAIEKLKELILSTDLSLSYGRRMDAENIADNLIANGVIISKTETVATDNNVGHKWIPVTERLPESGVHVLVACEMRGKYLSGQYVCDGYYVKAKTQPSYGHPDECAVEYSEEDDEYYLLEGWYEVIKNWDDYNSIVIDDFVTHWMPLPEPPEGERLWVIG
jgi:hypothetical protein